MNYYAIERSDDLEHGEWGNKATKYIKKILVNGKWRYIYKDATSKAKYAVNRVKEGAEEAVNNVKKKVHDEVKSLNRKINKNKIISENNASNMANDLSSGRKRMSDDWTGDRYNRDIVQGTFLKYKELFGKPYFKKDKHVSTFNSGYTIKDASNKDFNKAVESEKRRKQKNRKKK